MANTAFIGNMVITHPDGTIESDTFSNTDVSLAWCLFKNNANNNFYVVRKNGYISDISIGIVATDTTVYLKLYINEQDTGIMTTQNACFHTLSVRFPNRTPIPVTAGQTIMIQAIT
jgi:hypothetical protein